MRNLLVFALANITLFIFAQSGNNLNIPVSGQVLDSLTQETIPYATMRISASTSPDKVDKVTASDENGKFKFTMSKTGDYLLTIQFIGKKDIIKPFSIGTEKKLELGNLLMADDSEILGEVVVTSQRPLIKVDMDKITYSLEDDPESKTNNVLDMLRKVPMITVDGEDNIQLKGSSSFKIYMNGKPSNMITSNPKDVLRSMPANTIKDIEVITDPGAKYDAEGVAGIINIITHKQSELGGYTATINSRVDDRGGFGFGGYLSAKKGKLGFTGNYNYYEYKNPKGKNYTSRENYSSDQYKYLYQNGTNKWDGKGQYGSGEISYEIDTLNLLSVAFNRYAGTGKSKSSLLVEMENAEHSPQYSYNQDGWGEYTYGSTEVNVDYQRTFSVKDRLLTASYRYGQSPDDSESETGIASILNYNNSRNRQYSDAKTKEHTFQLDFTTPIAKIHKIETGFKYIIRQNESNSGYDTLNMSNNEWISRQPIYTDDFEHRQDILSAYTGYNIKVKSWGFKAGLRYEFTDLKAKYPIDGSQNFGTNYSNLVPSATVTYQLNTMQNIRFGYNMRISRPNIWQLNPNSNSADSSYISQGNPNLDAVKSHSFNMNYSLFKPKININVNMSYSFENNSIQRLTTIIDNISYTKPENIGKNKRLYLGGYFNWTPTGKLRINGNMSSSYTDIRANNDEGLKNHGFTSNISGGIQYTLPKEFKINAYGGYYSPWINLQGKGNYFHYHSLSLSKGFLKDKLNINLSASNPFLKDMTFKNRESTVQYSYESEFTNRRRSVNLSVSFRFGEMKAQIKKVQRGINNDDSTSSEGGGKGQGGSQ